MKTEKITFGKLKFIFERWRNYLGIISLFLAIRMNVLLSPIPWWWFVAGFFVSILFLYLDLRFVVTEESGTAFRKNSEWRAMKELLERINIKIDDINTKI